MTRKLTQTAVYDVLRECKNRIADYMRATEEDERPSMQVTIATDDSMSEWTFQTGDNSYTGPAYHYPHWAVVYLYRNSSCKDLAKDAMNQLYELTAQ